MKNLKTWQKVCIALCGVGLLFSILLFVPIVQNLILDFGENVVVHRPLTRPVWIGRFIAVGKKLCLIFILSIMILFCIHIKLPKKIISLVKNTDLQKCSMNIKTLCAMVVSLPFIIKFIINGVKGVYPANIANIFHIAMIFFLFAIATTSIFFCTKTNIENGFVFLSFVLGLMFLFSSTPFNVPDEEPHFCRAYEIAQGHFITDKSGGRNFNFNSTDFLKLEKNWTSFAENKRQVLHDDFYFMNFPTTGLYPPSSYIPQTIGIFIAKLFTNNFAFIFYAGRILSWIFVMLILFSAIRIAPTGKEAIALIALIPMNIHEAVSYAPDAQVVAISIFMVAYAMRAKAEPEIKFKAKDYIVLYGAAILISMIKISYLPFCLLWLLLPNQKFGGKRQKAIHAVIIAVSVLGLNLAWVNFCKQFLTKADTDAAGQLNFILSNPLSYVVILVRTYIFNGKRLFLTMLGSSLNELNLPTSTELIFIYAVYMVIKFLPPSKKELKFDACKICFLAIVVSIVLLISTSLYIQWTPLKNRVVKGLQGRYFLPLLFPLYFVFNSCDGKENEKCISILTVMLAIIINSCACLDLLGASA